MIANPNVVIHAAKQRRKATQTLAFASFLGAAAWASMLLPEWSGWTTSLLLIVPGLLAIPVMRYSIVSGAYLAQIAVNFGLTALILGSHWHPRLVSTVLTWTLAIAAGTLLSWPSLSRDAPSAPRSWLEPRWPHYALCGLLMGVSLFLALSQSSGYAAQIMNGRSTPTGFLGTLSVAAPIVTLTLLLNSLGSGGRSRLAISLAGAQVLIMASTGFRGAGVTFIIVILIGAALTLPPESAWRRISRLVIALPVILAIVILSFVLAANVKNSAANMLGVSNSGTLLFTPDNAVENTATRLQLSSSLDKAIEYRNDEAAKDAVSWTEQLKALVPRLLWPEKHDVDYGQRVSVAFYGLNYGQSSSTVTTIGDSLLNFGSFGLVLIGLFAGFAFRWLETRVRTGSGGLSVLLGVIVIYSAINQELPIVLIFVGILRNGLLAGALWTVATLIANYRHSDSLTREVWHVSSRS